MVSRLFWKLGHRCYPSLLKLGKKLRLVKEKPRFFDRVGFLKKGVSLEEFEEYLEENGYEWNVLAWLYEGEIFSFRKKIDKHKQYHIRLFNNREIGGHKEYVPERHPIKHVRDLGLSRNWNYFWGLLENWIE